MRVVNIDPLSDAALSLLREAAMDVRPLYGETPGPPWPKNSPLGPRDAYVAAYIDDAVVACGAFREIDTVTCEVRRMFTRKSLRRRGAARAVLSHLRNEARRLGYERMRLETGNRQTAAMSLYECYGFARIEPFGPYIDDPTSVCFELPVGKRQDE